MPLLIGIIVLVLLFFIWHLIVVPFFMWLEHWFTRIFIPRKYRRQHEIIKLCQRLNTIRERMPNVKWFADDLEVQQAGMKEMEALKREEDEIKERLSMLRR